LKKTTVKKNQNNCYLIWSLGLFKHRLCGGRDPNFQDLQVGMMT